MGAHGSNDATAGVWASKARLLEEGWCVVPDVLTAAEYRRRGRNTHVAGLDPNAANVHVFELLDIDPVFRDLIR
jgi:hypothetical protein